MVKHLPEILMLQRDLVKTFQNVTEMPCKTIDDFLRTHKAGTESTHRQRFTLIALSLKGR